MCKRSHTQTSMEFKIYLFVSIFILVDGYGLSANDNDVRHRRRPQIDQAAYYNDQNAAQSVSGLWPDNRNLITSASHTQVYQDEGDVAHSNFVMTVAPANKLSRHANDINLVDSLASAKTAEEYVTKAMKMHNQFEGGRKRVPPSSFTKYNFIEHPTPIETNRDIPAVEQNHQSNRHNYAHHNEPEKFVQEETSYYPPKTTAQPRPNHEQNNNYHHNQVVVKVKAPQNSPAESQRPNYLHQSAPPPVRHHVIKIIEDIPQPEPTKSIVSAIDKEQLMQQIEYSVMKMFHEMEQQKKREANHHKQFNHATTTRAPTPPTQSSQPSHQQMHHSPVQHHTIKILKKPDSDVSSGIVHNVDISVRDHRNRPRPIDVSALDDGKSYNHNTNFDHNGILKTAQGFDPTNVMHSKPVNKLHFNQQTYYDINALPYSADKDVDEPQTGGYYKKGYSLNDHGVGDHETSGAETSVGASISFGTSNHRSNNNNHQKQQHQPQQHQQHQQHQQQHEKQRDDDEQGYTTAGTIHIINGIPVANPYQMDLNTIRYMLGGLTQAQAYENDQKPSSNDYEDSYQGSSSTKSAKYHEHDSYSPKYNNNPKGQGYQEESPRMPRKQNHKQHRGSYKNDGSTFQHYQQHGHDENGEWSGHHGSGQRGSGHHGSGHHGSNADKHGGSGHHGSGQSDKHGSWDYGHADPYASSHQWGHSGDQYGSSTKTFQSYQSAPSGKAKSSTKFSKNSSSLKPEHSVSSSISSVSSTMSSSSSNSSNKNNTYRSKNVHRDVDVELRPPPKFLKF